MSGITDFAKDTIGAFTGSGGAKAATQAGGMQAEAIREGTALEVAAQREGIREARRQFNVQQQRLKPFQQLELQSMRRQAGQAKQLGGFAGQAADEMAALTGFSGTRAQKLAERSVLMSPAQQALRERISRQSLRGASAGGGISGNVLSALSQNLLQSDTGALGRRMQDLGGFVSMGSGGMGTMGTQAGTNLSGQFMQQFPGMISGLGRTQSQGVMGAGQAGASGLLGAAQSRAQGAQNMLQLGTNALSAASMGLF